MRLIILLDAGPLSLVTNPKRSSLTLAAARWATFHNLFPVTSGPTSDHDGRDHSYPIRGRYSRCSGRRLSLAGVKHPMPRAQFSTNCQIWVGNSNFDGRARSHIVSKSTGRQRG